MEPSRTAISVVWFFALGGLGVFFPFYSLYLAENAGLAGGEIGAVLAMLPLVGLVAQPAWGHLADRTGLRARVLIALCLGAAVSYTALAGAQGFAAIALTTAVLAVFSTPLIPTCVSVTLALAAGAGDNAFGRIRVWGTVGFFLTVVAFPWLLDGYQGLRGLFPTGSGPSKPGLGLMFPVTGALLLAACLVSLRLPRSGALSLRADRGDWRQLARHGPYLRLLVFVFAAYALLQGPMGIFPIFVRSVGGSLESVSRMWILMLVVEVPLVAFSGAGLARIGPRGLLFVGVVAGGLRWTICGLVSSLEWVYVVSLLHGVTVTGLIIGGPLYVESVVPARLRSTGQGLLAMSGISLGGITSNLGAGWLLEHFGPNAPYLVGGVGALLLGAALPLLLRPPHHLEPEAAP